MRCRGLLLAGCVAFLCAQFRNNPAEIAELNGPGDDVGGNAKLVVEKGGWIHGFFLLIWRSGVEGLLGFSLGDLLVLSFGVVADDEQKDSPC